MNASDWFAIQVMAAGETFKRESGGMNHPVTMRELLAVLALRSIANGDTKARQVREAATSALDMWLSKARKEKP